MRLDVAPYPDLQTAIAECCDAIDAKAGEVRKRYITTVPGQAETYLKKAEEAAAYKAAGYPVDLTPYGWIAAEVAARGITAQQAADGILARRDQYVALGQGIERERVKAKEAIRAASTIAGAIRARDAGIAALDVL